MEIELVLFFFLLSQALGVEDGDVTGSWPNLGHGVFDVELMRLCIGFAEFQNELVRLQMGFGGIRVLSTGFHIGSVVCLD